MSYHEQSFVSVDASDEDGHVFRSARFDPRNDLDPVVVIERLKTNKTKQFFLNFRTEDSSYTQKIQLRLS